MNSLANWNERGNVQSAIKSNKPTGSEGSDLIFSSLYRNSVMTWLNRPASVSSMAAEIPGKRVIPTIIACHNLNDYRVSAESVNSSSACLTRWITMGLFQNLNG